MLDTRAPNLSMDDVRRDLAVILGCDPAQVPMVFGGSEPYPLKTPVLYEIAAAHPSADTRVLHDWLGLYMSSRAYLEAVIRGHNRYGLDGSIEAPIGSRTKSVARRRLALLTRQGRRTPQVQEALGVAA